VIDAAGRFGKAEADVRADVEHHDIERADLGLDAIDERSQVCLLARVNAEGERLAAVRRDRVDKTLQLFRVARPARDADRETLGGERARNGAADAVASADDETGGRSIGQCCGSPASQYNFCTYWIALRLYSRRRTL